MEVITVVMISPEYDFVIITVMYLVEISYHNYRITFIKRIGPGISNLKTGAMNVTNIGKGSAARSWFRESDEILKIKMR